MSKQYVLTDGKRFLALDYNQSKYYITEDIHSACITQKQDLVGTVKDFKRYISEGRACSLMVLAKDFKIKEVVLTLKD